MNPFLRNRKEIKGPLEPLNRREYGERNGQIMKVGFLSIFILVALIVAPGISLADEKAPTSSKTVIITGEIQKPRSREIELAFESSLAHEISRHRLVLDDQNRFALTLNVPQGILIIGQYKDGQAGWKGWDLLRSFLFGHRYLFVLFVEPGDSLLPISPSTTWVGRYR